MIGEGRKSKIKIEARETTAAKYKLQAAGRGLAALHSQQVPKNGNAS